MILTIADRGTTGLGGPLRADELAEPDERADFVNFMRNVGERKELDLGGGSYGFGKGILYNVSRCHVVVADSVCIYRGRRQRRLIGAALGDGFRRDGRPYTGRHWLGPIEGGFARPLLDDEADHLAMRLGLPRFADDATGTTVVVVDVDLGRSQYGGAADSTRSAEAAADFIVSTMVWNLWPRMLEEHPNRLRCSMRRDGFPTPVPEPTSVVELRPFVESYRNVVDGEYEVPRRAQEPKEVGRFSLVRTMASVEIDAIVRLAAPFEGRPHHCARMRQADLVVDYVPGDSLVDEALQYGAVFRASAGADRHFAEAEPPTHDDWVLSGLRGTSRGVVQLANGFVRDKLRLGSEPATQSMPVGQTPLGYISSRLSGLMAGSDGGAATATAETSASRGGARRSAATSPRVLDGPILVAAENGPVVTAVVEMPAWASSRIVRVEPLVVVDGGVETSAERPGPEVVGWTAAETETFVPGAELTVSRDSPRRWTVEVRPLPDTVLRLRLSDEDAR